MKWFISTQQKTQLWGSLPGDAMVQMLKWFKRQLENYMEKIASGIIGHNIAFLAQDDHETEIPGRWENAVGGGEYITICSLFLLPSAPPTGRVRDTGLDCVVLWADVRQPVLCLRRPIDGMFIIMYLKKCHFYPSTLRSGEERLTLWNRRKQFHLRNG